MKKYTVLYCTDSNVIRNIRNTRVFRRDEDSFLCDADNSDHAYDQCTNAYPDCRILWVAETDSYDKALEEYYEI